MLKRREKVLRDIGESRLIDLVRTWLGGASPPAPHGMGDDCAVLPRTRGGRLLVTVDPVIRDRHFDIDTPPAAVAAKLINRNLSDIAAMGGTPRAAVISLAAPPDLPLAWLRAFHHSLARLALRAGIDIVGGDCSQTEGYLGASLTLIGEAPKRPLLRSGAEPGDLLFVTGTLGGSILGKHLRFSPRLAEGRWLANRRGVHAAIDLSDGLGKDVFALIPAGAKVVVDTKSLPVSTAARRLAKATKRPLLDCVFNDGEDYELLFCVHPNHAARLERDWSQRFPTRLTRIGCFETRNGRDPRLVLDPPQSALGFDRGYEHFR